MPEISVTIKVEAKGFLESRSVRPIYQHTQMLSSVCIVLGQTISRLLVFYVCFHYVVTNPVAIIVMKLDLM
jgi:hypothetical protein